MFRLSLSYNALVDVDVVIEYSHSHFRSFGCLLNEIDPEALLTNKYLDAYYCSSINRNV